MPSSQGPRARAAVVEADPRWAAVQARDARAEGAFFYAVVTTGVYCRPSCAARQPRPGNVVFFASAAAARRAGFRPCRRCQPDEPPLAERRAAQVVELCRLLESSERVPTLEALGRRVGMSPFHVQRVFKAATGVTPRAYAAAHRAERVREALASAETITAAICDAGYGSSSRFYETSNQRLGMTPSELRAGGAGEEIRFAVAPCSLGLLLVAATARGVCALFLGDAASELARELARRFPAARLVGGDAEFEKLVARVVGCVEEPAQAVHLPLDVRGTAFQQRVWQALRAIPAGQTRSYSELAAAAGAPTAVRAVAQACAANPVAVLIPCHRAVRRDGSLSGYRWGVERKRALLAREAKGGRSGQPAAD